MGLPMSDFQARLILQSLEAIGIVTSESKLVEAKKWGLGTGPLPTGKKNMTSNRFLNLQYMFWTRKQRTQVRKGTELKLTGALLLTNRPQSYFPPQNLHLLENGGSTV